MGFWLCNALGFFIQFFPCALTTFLPFSEEAFDFPRKRIFQGVTIVSLVLAAVFPGVLYGVRTAWGDDAAAAAANLYMLCAILLELAAHVRLVHETLSKKMLAFYIVLFYAVSQYYLVLLVANFYADMPMYNSTPAYCVYDLLAYAGTSALLLPLMLCAVIRPLGEFNREIRPGTMRREYFFTILSSTVCFLLMVYCNTVWQTTLDGMTIHLRWLVPMSLFPIFEQGVIYWLVFRESVRRQRDNERQSLLRVQQLQYEKIIGEMESSSRLRHDLRHHLNTLGALNAQGRQEEITEYLKQYGAVYDRLERQKISGDPVVDSVLEYYLALAREASVLVKCKVSLRGASGVEPVDMTVLLGNCLENALEALRQIPEGQRRLSIEMIPAKAMILLRIQNTCNLSHDSGEPVGWGDFASSKGNGHQGVGLRSVTAIAEKYDGSAQFQCKGGEFITRVFLNPANPQEQNGGVQ